MATFDELKPGARLRGLDPAGEAEIVQVARYEPDAANLTYRVDGEIAERLLYRGEESGFEWVQGGRAYGFDADGELMRPASEAYRIRLAHLFDPIWRSTPRKSRLCRTRSQPSMARCSPANPCGSCWPMTPAKCQ